MRNKTLWCGLGLLGLLAIWISWSAPTSDGGVRADAQDKTEAPITSAEARQAGRIEGQLDKDDKSKAADAPPLPTAMVETTPQPVPATVSDCPIRCTLPPVAVQPAEPIPAPALTGARLTSEPSLPPPQPLLPGDEMSVPLPSAPPHTDRTAKTTMDVYLSAKEIETGQPFLAKVSLTGNRDIAGKRFLVFEKTEGAAEVWLIDATHIIAAHCTSGPRTHGHK